uniref:Uncharacterized protein n=1 Tax=Ditylenchus dipsaci TaxID=166011 RepID=A0A915CPW6_9BILA
MSSILLKINKIRDDNKQFDNHKADSISALHNYLVYNDDVMRKVCVEAELHADCLDQGSSLTDLSYYCVSREGVIPGDVPFQIIDKRLGGPGYPFNVIPLNSKLDMSSWNENEQVIYNHLKCNKTVRMLFAFEYDDESENEFCRPIKMYYHFVLNSVNNDKNHVIEGVINNSSPRNN